jgi:hypothetical protein
MSRTAAITNAPARTAVTGGHTNELPLAQGAEIFEAEEQRS